MNTFVSLKAASYSLIVLHFARQILSRMYDVEPKTKQPVRITVKSRPNMSSMFGMDVEKMLWESLVFEIPRTDTIGRKVAASRRHTIK